MAFQVPRMDPLQSRAWLALVWTSELLPAALDTQLQGQAGLTHFEFMVLSVLSQADDRRLRTKDLAAATNATMPRLSRVVGKLAERGLVERVGDGADARVIHVHLTADGRRALVRALPDHIAFARRLVIDHLDPAQLEALADALEPLVARLDPQQRTGLSGAGEEA